MRIPFGRRAASNVIGRRITAELAALRQAATGILPPSVDPGELERLCCAGDTALVQIRERTHDALPRDLLDREASAAFLREARKARQALNRPPSGPKTVVRLRPAGSATARAGGKVECDVPDPNRFTFQLADPATGLAEELAQLARLHRDGSLTRSEFQRAKDRLLDDGAHRA